MLASKAALPPKTLSCWYRSHVQYARKLELRRKAQRNGAKADPATRKNQG